MSELTILGFTDDKCAELVRTAIEATARRCAEIADRACADEFGFPQGLPGEAILREFGLSTPESENTMPERGHSGPYADTIINLTTVSFDWRDRVRILFHGNAEVRLEIDCETPPGELRPNSS